MRIGCAGYLRHFAGSGVALQNLIHHRVTIKRTISRVCAVARSARTRRSSGRCSYRGQTQPACKGSGRLDGSGRCCGECRGDIGESPTDESASGAGKQSGVSAESRPSEGCTSTVVGNKRTAGVGKPANSASTAGAMRAPLRNSSCGGSRTSLVAARRGCVA